MSKKRTLDSIFNPTSVAIAGVAPGNSGQAFLDSLLDSGFKGKVYLLNPKGGEISGLKVYASIKDVPEPIDYVISCVPASSLPRLIEECATKGVSVISPYTAGFSESGSSEGEQLEIEIRRLAQAGGLRILGPNCLGVYSPKVGLSFASDFPGESGQVALICQSGGNAIYLIRAAAQRGVRFSKAVSYGNACDIDESDLLEYFIQDAETKIVAAYIEGAKDGRRFYRVLKRLSKAKPVAVLKAGYTAAGAGAAASHTGALAGSDDVWDSLLQQAGAVRVYTLEELVDMMVTFSFLHLPKGKRVAIFGGGGGASVLATDECTTAGFVVSPLPQQIRGEIDTAVRSFLKSDAGMILHNPVDLTPLASDEGLYQVIRRLSTYEGVDLLIAHNVISASGWPYPGSPFGIWPDLFADAAIKTYGETGKPMAVVLHHIASNWDLQRALGLQQRYWEAGLPAYHSMAGAAKAIDRFLRYHQKRPTATKGG